MIQAAKRVVLQELYDHTFVFEDCWKHALLTQKTQLKIQLSYKVFFVCSKHTKIHKIQKHQELFHIAYMTLGSTYISHKHECPSMANTGTFLVQKYCPNMYILLKVLVLSTNSQYRNTKWSNIVQYLHTIKHFPLVTLHVIKTI